MSMDLNKLYAARFPEQDLAKKAAIWKVLCEDFFQQFINPSDTVLDLGAGHGDFLCHIRAVKKIAVELNPEASRWLPPGTTVIAKPSWELGEVASGSVNAVFASNFFEHLPTKDKLLRTLGETNRVLVKDGKLIILQPNLAYLTKEFFDFIDHHLPLSHKSMIEALSITGFKVERCIPKFLPFTTRSRMPQKPWLVRWYLRVPPAWWILGRQFFILARKFEDAGK
jgi:SAM-dependent methyltransferase